MKVARDEVMIAVHRVEGVTSLIAVAIGFMIPPPDDVAPCIGLTLDESRHLREMLLAAEEEVGVA